jgi:6-phosphofructokinase 1
MKIGLLTSGGDSPGMNNCILGVVKTSISHGHKVIGIERGYQGLMEKKWREMSLSDVEGIGGMGGTILGSARCKEMMTDDGLNKAVSHVNGLGLDALVIVGGNGSLTGARRLVERGAKVQIVGIPGSIDNDLGGTSLSVGADTALNTIVASLDKISDSARSHGRVHIVEVMGRHCGFLAMRSGIACEADVVLYGEKAIEAEILVNHLSEVARASFARGKKRVLIVKAEGFKIKAHELTERLQARVDKELPGVEVRETVLGHVVRGGSPSAMDRTIGVRLGFGAVCAIERGLTDIMMGWEPPKIPDCPSTATEDPSVSYVTLPDMLKETDALLNGTSAVTKVRVALLERTSDILAL